MKARARRGAARFLCLALAGTATLGGACGGKVVLDESGATTGSGGAGGTATASGDSFSSAFTSGSTSAFTSSSTSAFTSSSSTSVSTSSSSSSGSPTCGPVAGLLAYYPLDTDTLDHSGNGNDALGVDLMPVPGKVGFARAFDGTSSSLHATGAAALNGARTLCAWVAPNQRAGLGQPVFSGGVTDNGDFFSVSASSPSGGTCPAAPGDVPFIDHWGSPCYEVPAFVVNAGTWHLVCYLFDGSGEVTFYVDGNVATLPGAEYDYPLATLYLGSTGIGGTTTQPSLLGSLDEVTVWTRALDASDLAALWNGSVGCAAL
jgi:hypothetical protein